MRFIIPYILALIVLVSNPVWFLWDIRFYIVFALVFILAILLIPRLRETAKWKVLFSKIPFLMFFISYFLIIVPLVGGFQTYLLVSSLILFLYVFISKEEKSKALDILTSILSFILLFSLLFWILHHFVFQVPMFNTISYYETKGSDKILENYILFIQPTHDFIVRFYSIFDEPGTVGTLTAFILYGNKYNFKDKRNIILLLASIVTFSMAFYLLFIIGFFIQKFKVLNKMVLYLFSFGILSFFVFLIFKDNATFQITVIDRFLNFSNSIDSRESHYLASYFQQFFSYDSYMIGKGRSFITNNPMLFDGQSYKFFIIEFGVIGVLVTVITYLSLVEKYNLLSIGCFLLFFISFVQRPFLLEPWQIVIFIIIISQFNSNNLNEKVDGRSIG